MIDVKQVMDNPGVSLSRRLTLLFIFSILLTGALFAFFETIGFPSVFRKIAWLEIDEVKITSEWPLSPSQIKSWLPPLEKHSILSVHGAEIVRHLKAKSWVDWVTVKKEYPNRVIIEVGTKKAQAIEVTKGQAYFLAGDGERIEKASPAKLAALDLPVITRERETKQILRPPRISPASPWNLTEIVRALDRFQTLLNSRYAVSQVVLGSYPYFKVFLSKRQLEVNFSFENWEAQLPILALLLHSPPRQIGQPQRINLILPKKAVVSSTLSN